MTPASKATKPPPVGECFTNILACFFGLAPSIVIWIWVGAPQIMIRQLLWSGRARNKEEFRQQFRVWNEDTQRDIKLLLPPRGSLGI
jgi:hypothetical protein